MAREDEGGPRTRAALAIPAMVSLSTPVAVDLETRISIRVMCQRVPALGTTHNFEQSRLIEPLARCSLVNVSFDRGTATPNLITAVRFVARIIFFVH